ncbi:MAG: hypothetical protein O3C29_06680 [Proteobacteria bacterium]|nr:hypothetical protein [Pseudomonadota bacterium]MDA1292127.1 hypothetical protein [Pseudomonadota bacterium]
MTEDKQCCEAHLRECLDCLDFYLANSSAQVRGDAKQSSLSKRVFDALGTHSCVEAEEQMSDYFSARLESFQNGLIQSHLDNCSNCEAMYAAYENLATELSCLRELVPEVDLTEAILAKTLSRTQRIQRTVSRWQQRFSVLTLRPRFSLKASMFGTLIWMVTFGIPAGALDRDSSGLGVIAAIEQGADSAQRRLVSVNANLNARFERVQPLLMESMNAVEGGSRSLLRERVEQTRNQGDELLRRVEEITERQID